MKCIYCRGKTTVTETAKMGVIVLRKRRCEKCREVFYTEESCIVYHTDLLQKFSNVRRGEVEIE